MNDTESLAEIQSESIPPHLSRVNFFADFGAACQQLRRLTRLRDALNDKVRLQPSHRLGVKMVGTRLADT